MMVALSTVQLAAATPPVVTAVAPVKSVPVIVTLVPPAVLPVAMTASVGSAPYNGKPKVNRTARTACNTILKDVRFSLIVGGGALVANLNLLQSRFKTKRERVDVLTQNIKKSLIKALFIRL
jgi:hypothetical protein